ncbi:cytochrome P450 [Lentzea tibetensis]|uniref:Cytochrome P450 n=1 Tax=Lentzea tibetensis TaxID=2591470 RepID=A0A563EIP4_9PSEU|nr:cytochrome P450 [Lentzea tibetensis]TWP46684.1 cytochrome P450 [Lentzea tibetensis]
MTSADQAACPYPFGEADRLELHPEYGRLRDTGRPARVTLPYGGEAWMALNHADVRTVLTDPRFSRAATVGQDVPRVVPMIIKKANIGFMDGAEHARLRKLVAKAFTGRQTARLRPRIEEIVDGLLDDIIATGAPADLLEGLAMVLPMHIMCELLGVPFADRDRFRDWSEVVRTMGDTYTAEQYATATNELESYLAGMIARRREEPSDDLLGVLVAARDEGERLTETELVQFGVLLLIAGHDTTANYLANSIYCLLSRPDQLERLRSDPSLLPTAVDELLRYLPLGTTAGVAQIALEDVELSGGVVVRKGEAVLTQAAAANFDENVFADADELDLARTHNPMLTFGHGPHHCVGAQLAKVEIQVAIGSLLRRIPGVRLAKPVDEIEFRYGSMIRGLVALPVTW